MTVASREAVQGALQAVQEEAAVEMSTGLQEGAVLSVTKLC